MTWETITLGEVISIKHGWAFKGDHFVQDGESIVLTPGSFHVSGGLKLKGEKEKYYDGDFPEEYILSQGDMLVVMTDLKQTAPILGGALIIPEENRFLHNQRLGLVEIKNPSKIDFKLLYYIFNSEFFRSQVRSAATGATVRHTAPTRIYDCKVPCPKDIHEQKLVASILSAYDDLIANNTRRMELLEESMRLLYRDWFVHLRFPGYERVKIIDDIPEEWAKNPLADVCELTMGQSPPSEYYNTDGEGLPFHQGVTDYGKRFITHRKYCTQIKRVAEPGDILFSVRAPVGRINLTLDRIVIGRGLAAIRNKQSFQSFQYYQLKSQFHQENMIGGGAIFASVTKKQLSQQMMLQPKRNIIDEFERIAIPVDQQIANLHIQNQRLVEARDILLPRLMNGSIPV